MRSLICVLLILLCVFLSPIVSAKAGYYTPDGWGSSLENVVIEKPAPTPQVTAPIYYEEDDPFMYLSAGYDLLNNRTNEETKHFVASWYQVLRYASISGFVVFGIATIISWSVSNNPNKRAEKKRSFMWKCILLVGICSLSWILSIVFEILDKLR